MRKVVDVSGGKMKLIKEIAGKEDTFIFLDPPYYPVPNKSGKISLNNLYNGHFSPLDFLKLKLHCDHYTREGIPWILTNSDCEFIRLLFKDYPIISTKENHELKKAEKGETDYKANCVIITNMEEKEDFMDKIGELNGMMAGK